MAKYEKWLQPENLERIEAWAKAGLTDAQISHNMGIGRTSLHEWKKRFPDILNALTRGKAVADFMVEQALFMSATGYDVLESEGKLDRAGNVVQTNRLRHINADPTAQIFWLKNRKPGEWSDKPQSPQDTSQLDKVAEILKPIPKND